MKMFGKKQRPYRFYVNNLVKYVLGGLSLEPSGEGM